MPWESPPAQPCRYHNYDKQIDTKLVHIFSCVFRSGFLIHAPSTHARIVKKTSNRRDEPVHRQALLECGAVCAYAPLWLLVAIQSSQSGAYAQTAPHSKESRAGFLVDQHSFRTSLPDLPLGEPQH